MIEARFFGGPLDGGERWIDTDDDRGPGQYVVNTYELPSRRIASIVYEPRRVAGCFVMLQDQKMAFDYAGTEH